MPKATGTSGRCGGPQIRMLRDIRESRGGLGNKNIHLAPLSDGVRQGIEKENRKEGIKSGSTCENCPRETGEM